MGADLNHRQQSHWSRKPPEPIEEEHYPQAGATQTVSAPRTAAIVVAAGRGTRAGGHLPKQYRDLDGRPVLSWAIDVFQAHTEISDVVVVIHPEDEELFNQRIRISNLTVCFGGSKRTESVYNGLRALAGQDIDRVLIHDGARPFISSELIDRLCSALEENSGAVPGLSQTDATFLKEGAFLKSPVDREALVRVQTPQAFSYPVIVNVFEKLAADASAHDEASLALAAGIDMAIVPGDPQNIKITFAEDFAMARPSRLPVTVSGQGFDVHRLAEGDGIWLCGVFIACPLQLVGHSDADAGLHALTDALLGAIGEGDIGQHFPPTDPQWKNTPSSRFVEHAVDLAHKSGSQPAHADITLICEQPKIGPHRDAMRARVASLLGLETRAVNIKATTTEGLGYTGRGEGLAAQATVTVKRHE